MKHRHFSKNIPPLEDGNSDNPACVAATMTTLYRIPEDPKDDIFKNLLDNRPPKTSHQKKDKPPQRHALTALITFIGSLALADNHPWVATSLLGISLLEAYKDHKATIAALKSLAPLEDFNASVYDAAIKRLKYPLITLAIFLLTNPSIDLLKERFIEHPNPHAIAGAAMLTLLTTTAVIETYTSRKYR